MAAALNNQANRQSEMGQREAALQSIEEAVKIRRELAARNREMFLPNLATGLQTFGRVLVAAGNPIAAAAKFAEGLRLITPFALQLPHAHISRAVGLAQDYLSAAQSANLTPEPETLRCLTQIAHLLEQLRDNSTPPESDSATA